MGDRKGRDSLERDGIGCFRMELGRLSGVLLEVSDTLLADSEGGASSSQVDDEEVGRDEDVLGSILESATAEGAGHGWRRVNHLRLSHFSAAAR